MYGKVFASMFKGSLYGQWEAIVTFTVMIVLADQHGEVDMTPEALAASTSIPLDIIRKGIADLERPDPKSRTPDEEGRRILRVSDARDWGWRITNYEHYRKMRSQEERREYMRLYQRERRAAEKAESTTTSTPVNNVTHAVSSKQEVEGQLPSSTAAETVLAALPEIARPAFEKYGASGPDALARSLTSLHAPITGGASYSWEQIGQGLVDYAAAGRDKFVPVSFKRFLETNAQPPVASVSRTNGATKHDDTNAAIAEGVRLLNAAGVNYGK